MVTLLYLFQYSRYDSLKKKTEEKKFLVEFLIGK